MTIEAGTTFTFRIAPGRIGVCRVLGEGEHASLFVMVARWSGPEGASLATMKRAKAFHEPQPHTHHSWGKGILAGMAQTKIPRSVERVGVVEVTKKERALFPQMATNSAGWTWLLDQAKRQWRWDNEREKVLVADAREESAQKRAEARAVKAAAKKMARLGKTGPKALLRRVWFTDFEPEKKRRAAREIVKHLLTTVVKSKRDAKRDVKQLADAVVAFNRLDGRFGSPFDTIDRELIMEALGEIGASCKISDAVFDRAVDAKRDF